MDVAQFEIAGARPVKPSKYTPLATLAWIGGLQTQRSPFLPGVEPRYDRRYLGGKPDALLAGSNVELSNKLTLQRRPGLLTYGTDSVPPVKFFYQWQQATLANFVSIVDPSFTTYPEANLQLILDTATTDGTTVPGNIYNYSPTAAGILLHKAPLSQQTSFYTIVNTMYFGDGVDLYKMAGANLLTYSNTFGNSPWVSANASLATGVADPTGAANATTVTWGTTGTSAKITQAVTPNYTPVASNKFTLSLWMKQGSGGANTVNLRIEDQSANTVVDTSFAPTTSWALYQVTGLTLNTATSLKVYIYDPSTTNTVLIYGAQLEIGGPATPTVITQNQPLGLYLWGIQAPANAPSFSITSRTGSTGASWQPDHAYSAASALSLTSVDASTGTTAVYHGTITGGAGNAFVDRFFKITGFSNASNNSVAPGFICTASTATTLTLTNSTAVSETHAGSALVLDDIIDKNGNFEVAYVPGTSGGAEPNWSPVVGDSTPDGLQNFIAQTLTPVQAPGSSVSGSFPNAVTATNTKLIFIAAGNNSGVPGTVTVTDSSGDAPTLLLKQVTHNFAIYLYYVLSATAGSTTISVTGGGTSGTWLGAVEIPHMTATDGDAGNQVQNASRGAGSATFLTGSVTTTNAQDILVTFAMFDNNSSALDIGNIPDNFQIMASQSPTSITNGFWNIAAAFEFLSVAGSFNPEWTVSNSTAYYSNWAGITAAFKSSVGSLVWYNVGPNPTATLSAGLTAQTGYQWYYSLVNIYTGHRSNVSPISSSTGAITGATATISGTGCPTPNSGTGASAGTGDPQVTAIEVYRNTDGGGFWFQIPPELMQNVKLNGTPVSVTVINGVSYLLNPGSATASGTWSFDDVVPDSSLNTQIYAPVGFLNSPPPAGLTNLEFFSGRLWGSVGNFLYFATGADDATLLNILQNGVPPESWEPTNFITFNSPIVRLVAVSVGLIVFTTTDVWVVTGSSLANYNPTKSLTGVGLGTYNGVVIDGSTMMLQTRDRQCLMLNVSSGASEIGFVIGDVIETNINPITCYLARHVHGSQDNAFYLADGATGWFRLNPNQYGASASGEQNPVWSPFATIASAGGCGAIASIETQPGIKSLLVSRATGVGPVLVRDLNTFSDNGTEYTWSATIGSIVLALPGRLAEVESITTEFIASSATQCSVAVLLDEISGDFEILHTSTPDPPQLANLFINGVLVSSKSVLSNRFFLSSEKEPPVARHIQIQLGGVAATTKDELLSLTILGALVAEQS